MSLDLGQLNLLVSYDERIAVIQKLIEEGQYLKEIQIYLHSQFVSPESTESWINYCLNLWIWASENEHFQVSHLNTDQFLTILKRTSDFAQRRVLWDLQAPSLKQGDYFACQYLKRMVAQVQGSERSYLRKVLSSLEEGLASPEEPQWRSELSELSLEHYKELSREQKLFYLKEISHGTIPLPFFALDLIGQEPDSFVASSIGKVFPQLLKSSMDLEPMDIVAKFSSLANHQDARVRANCLEGLCAVFESTKKDADFYRFLLHYSQDPDGRVKANALRGIGLYSKSESKEVLESALKSCQSMEELDSLVWLLQGLGNLEEFQTVIKRSRARLGRKSKKTSEPAKKTKAKKKSEDDEAVLPMSERLIKPDQK